MGDIKIESEVPPVVPKNVAADGDAAEEVAKLTGQKSMPSETFRHQMSAKEKIENYENTYFEEDNLPDLPPVAPSARRCTDLLCLILFFLYWIAQIAVAGFGFANGNPKLLIYGTDNLGNLCGGDENFTDREFLALPRLTLDVQEAIASDDIANVRFFGVCMEACPQEGDIVCSDLAEETVADEIEANGGDREDIISQCLTNANNCIAEVVLNECFFTVFNTTSFLFRCLPEFIFSAEILEDESGCTKNVTFTNARNQSETTCLRFRTVEKITTEEPPDSNIISDTFNTVGRKIEQIASDIIQTMDIVGYVGLLFSLLASVAYVSLLWVVVGPVVWGSVVLIIVSAVSFTLYLYIKSGLLSADGVESLLNDLNNELLNATGGNVQFNLSTNDLEVVSENFPAVSQNYQAQYEVAAYAFTGITILLCLIILCMIPKIAKAVAFFKEASHTLRANLGLLFVPPIVALLLLANAAFFLGALAYTQTCGEIEIKALNFTIDIEANVTGLTTSQFGQISNANIIAIFLFFGFLWTTNFIQGVSTMVISHVITQSYWNTEPGKLFYKAGSIKRGWLEIIRYHLGTVAFGSLLIAFVQLLRYIATFVDQKTKNIQESNRIVKYAMKAVHCFLYCAEQCIKFVSRQAYIMTAMYGKSFCQSSKMAFFAIAANLSQVGAVVFLGEIVLRFGQILITLLAGMIAAYALDADISDSDVELASVLPTVVICMVFAWVISGGVLNIYDVAVDTLLLSYCQDKKRLKLRGHGADDMVKPHKGLGHKSLNNFMDSHKLNKDKLANQSKLYTF